jgi:hypothetical protein
MEKHINKLTPKQSDRLLNYMEVTTLFNKGKLTVLEAQFYFDILNIIGKY